MNKADEKKLHADPRYKAIMAAYAVLRDRLAENERQRVAVLADFEAAAGVKRSNLNVATDGALDDRSVFSQLRPRGDMVATHRLARDFLNEEIESVSATQVVVGNVTYRLPKRDDCDAYETGRHFEARRIKAADVAKIKAGELKGWRQKTWGST